MTCGHPAPSPCYFSYPPPPPYVPPPPPPPQLKECHVEARIVDVHSFVTLSQKFHNPANVATTELTYNFTVLAGAAICGFKMIRPGLNPVIGVIKDKELALQEINTAKAQGHAFALGEELTKDVFSISVGNINAGETVSVIISYISPLIDDDAHHQDIGGFHPQIRFTLPLAYLQRAGQAPSGKLLTGVHPTNVPFTMELSIKQFSPIIKYCTPGYTPTATIGRDGEANREHSLHLSFPSTISSADIIVVITASMLDFSRAFIEQQPSHDPPSSVLSLTLVPGDEFDLEVTASTEMEYIVLVDESSSMAGLKLEMTRKALEFLLDQLPSTGSYFNIFEFGETVRRPGFSHVSKPKDDVTVGRAKNYIASMKADLGANKQISQALKHVFDSLPAILTRPVSIFLITDGAAWDVKDCMSITQESIASQSTETNFMRVFTLGLGDGASTETCDGIARAGGGVATYIATADQSFLGRCVRLVSAARSRPITDIKIFREDESPPPPTTLAAPSTPGPLQQPRRIFPPSMKRTGSAVAGAQTEPYVRHTSRTPTRSLLRAQQAPTKPSFFKDSRFSVFAIVPQSSTAQSTLKVELTIPSHPDNPKLCFSLEIQDFTDFEGMPFLHTLAVKQIITDLEDKHAIAPALEALELQGEIVYYGKKYGLTSRFTSFVAIDDGRAVGLANDVSGTTSVLPRRLTNSERRAVPSTPRSFSASSSRSKAASSVRRDDVADKGKLPEPDDLAIVFELSSLQSSDGGFGNNAAKVIKLVSPYCPKRASRILEEYPLIIRSVFLVRLWILLWGRIEATLILKKVDVWIKTNVGPNIDVKAIQKKLYQTAN